MTDNKDVVVRGVKLSEYMLVLDQELPQYASGYFSVIPRALKYDKEISSDAKILWEIINDYAGTNRLAFPSHATLAKDMGKSVASIKRYLDELISNGWMTAQNRIGTSNFYYCAVPMEHYKTFEDPSIEGNYVPTIQRRNLPELPKGSEGGSSSVS
ncbi:helix-turn-helix domain-containing protein [Streptomyces sp. NPDC003656]